jgi:DNA-binding response OmpR family regulator
MNQRLSEILNEIDLLIHRLSELQIEERTIIQASSSNVEIPVVLLNFNDAAQTIIWNNSHLLRLARKSYLLVKTLWNSKRRRATIMKLENCVWKGKTRKPFIERHAICSMINRTQKKLEAAAFPYKIRTLKTKIKNHAKPQIKGWQLVCAQRTKKY